MKSRLITFTKSYFILILCFGWAVPSQAHYAKVTNFHLSENHTGYDVNVKIDLADVLYTLQNECDDFEAADINECQQMIQDYIYDCFIVKTDRQVTEFHLSTLSFDDHFILLHGHLPMHSHPDELEIYSSCMINTVKNQSNIISVTHRGSKRSFRLHRSRMRTKIAI